MYLLQVAFAAIIASVWMSKCDSADCYKICHWSSTAYVGARANLLAADCAHTPPGEAWLHVVLSYGTQPNDDIYLRIRLSDSRMANGLFQPQLFFSHYDPTNGKPVVITDLIAQGSNPNEIRSTFNPPDQGDIFAHIQSSPNLLVRLRHRNTDNCLTVVSNTNGGIVVNVECKYSYNTNQLFKLVSAGGNSYRLHHSDTDQCLYALNSNGATVHHWACWMDPNMRFKLIPSLGGYRLQHINYNVNQCVYGNSALGGQVHSWACWDHDPNMVFNIDIVVRQWQPSDIPCAAQQVQPPRG